MQTKVAADLQERLKERASAPQDEHEPTILEDQHQTRLSGIVIGILLLIFFGVIVGWVLHIAGIF